VIVLSERYAGELLARLKLAEVTKGAYPKFSRSALKSFKTVALLKVEFHILKRAILPVIATSERVFRASLTHNCADVLAFRFTPVIAGPSATPLM
jgi:hypothetical protein